MADQPLSIDAYLDSRIATPDSPTPVPEGHGNTIELSPSGVPVDPPVAEPVTEPVVPAPEPGVETPVEPVEPTLTVEERATAGEFAQGRFRIKDEGDKALIMYARSNGITIAEAAAVLHPQATPAPAAAPTLEPEPTTLASVIQGKEARLAEVRAAIKGEIDAAGESGVTVTREFRAMQEEEMDLARELPVLIVDHKMEVAREQRNEQREFNTSYDQWEDAAKKDFPDLTVPTSTYFQSVAAESARLAVSKDPQDRALLLQPDCAYLVATRVARQVGYKPAVGVAAVAPAATPTPAAPAAVPAPAALPRAIGAAPGSSGSDAHRVTVAAPAASALESYRQAVAVDRSASGIMAGLDSMYKGMKAGAAA